MRAFFEYRRSPVFDHDVNKKEKEAGSRVITIRNMETSYHQGRSFRVEEACFEEGKITSILGRNGCGKTTVLRTMTGFLPYRGSIKIDGKESRDYTVQERARKAAFLPQMMKAVKMDVGTLVEHGRFPWLGSFRRMSGADKEVIAKALEMTQMASLKRRDLTQLSGGELRRAYLAMVIAQDADMILLDEPTTYMDIESQELFFEIVRSLADSGRGIVMTCHDIGQSFSVSDRILLMDDGIVAKTGTPDDLEQGREDLVRLFGAAVKRIDGENLLYPYVLVK